MWMCCQVNLLDAMENMDQETFEFRFGEELVYTTLLSDGQMVELIPGGSNVGVRYEDRKEFIRLVQNARLEEGKQQVEHRFLVLSRVCFSVCPVALIVCCVYYRLQPSRRGC